MLKNSELNSNLLILTLVKMVLVHTRHQLKFSKIPDIMMLPKTVHLLYNKLLLSDPFQLLLKPIKVHSNSTVVVSSMMLLVELPSIMVS